MKSSNKIEAIIYLTLVVALCAALVGGLSNIMKKSGGFFDIFGDDKQNITTTTGNASTTKPKETTKTVDNCFRQSARRK